MKEMIHSYIYYRHNKVVKPLKTELVYNGKNTWFQQNTIQV